VINMTEYVTNFNDVQKEEFKDLLRKFGDNRETYHAYSVGRLCTYGTVMGLDYGFDIKDDDHIIKYLILPDIDTLEFSINIRTNGAEIITENYKEKIYEFLKIYDTDSENLAL